MQFFAFHCRIPGKHWKVCGWYDSGQIKDRRELPASSFPVTPAACLNKGQVLIFVEESHQQEYDKDCEIAEFQVVTEHYKKCWGAKKVWSLKKCSFSKSGEKNYQIWSPRKSEILFIISIKQIIKPK